MASSVSPGFSSSVSPTKNSLVANYTIAAPDGSQVRIDFGPTTQYGRSTWEVPAPVGSGVVSILVAGMLPDTQYHMRAAIRLEDGSTVYDGDHTFSTGPLPATGIPRLSVTSPGIPCPGVELVNMNPGSPVAAELDGSVCWYYYNEHDLEFDAHPMPLRQLSNGNFMVLVTNRYTKDNTPYCVLREVDLTSTTVSNEYGLRELHMAVLNERLQNIKTPFGRTVHVNYYSHDFYPMENGHVILLCQEFLDVEVNGQLTRVMGDALVDLDPQFNPVWVWSIVDVLDVNRHPFLWEPSHDWTHCNAVQPTPDGNLMLSVRNQSWVFKIDYANGSGSGQVLWKLGFEGNFALQDTGPANWFFAQHYPHILTTQGTNITSITVVDNGNYRPGTDPPPFSRGLIVEMDETQKTAQIAWQFPISPDFFSYWGGNVVQLPNGNMEICMSRPSPQHSTAFEVDYDTKSVVWQMDIAPPYAYRSYRIPSLYPGVQW